MATAAASGLGRQLTRYAAACGIGTIAVVRRSEQTHACREEGALEVLDASAESFAQDLKVCSKAEGLLLPASASRATLYSDAKVANRQGFRVRSLTRPFRDARRFPSTWL